jgi:signal transduction histidine kinase
MIGQMSSTKERIGRSDVAIAVAFSVFAIVQMIANVTDDKVNASALVVPFGIALTVPLLWRRAAPLAAIGATLAGLLLHGALFGEVVRCGVVFPVLLVLAFSAGVRLERDRSLAALGLTVLVAVVVCLTDGPTGAPLGAMVFMAPVSAAVWGVGRAVRSRGQMADELVARTSELREARDERSRLEVETDRARLSSELDELLQRRLGELAALADAGARDGEDPAAATARLVEIEQESRRTLEEMRSVVGVLRDDGSGAATAPQPALTQLEALLVRAKGTGARMVVEGNPRVLPAGVELSAYRVVEHLLDALADAPGVEVTVRFTDADLELAISGPSRRRGDSAIERARERVRVQRGTLEASTRGGRTEALVSLPVLAAV